MQTYTEEGVMVNHKLQRFTEQLMHKCQASWIQIQPGQDFKGNQIRLVF